MTSQPGPIDATAKPVPPLMPRAWVLPFAEPCSRGSFWVIFEMLLARNLVVRSRAPAAIAAKGLPSSCARPTAPISRSPTRGARSPGLPPAAPVLRGLGRWMREAAEELRQLEMLCLEEIGRQFLRSTGPWLPRSHQQGPTATRGHGWPQD